MQRKSLFPAILRRIYGDIYITFPFIESRSNGISQSVAVILIKGFNNDPVHQDMGNFFAL